MLTRHPEIDFFIYREGEQAFVGLYHALKKHGFLPDLLKQERACLPGVHYQAGGEFVAGDPAPLIEPLDLIPSPYLNGMCDRFLAQGHSAIIQAARGCPFRCTYCQEGNSYFNHVRRYSDERTIHEFWHVGERAKHPILYLADSNFGMYKQDVELAQELSKVQEKYKWPDFIVCISGKNNKAQVLQTAAILKGGLFSAAIQSSNPQVLENISRQNVSTTEMIEAATEQDLDQTHSFSEIIVALPGDTFQAHCRSACELMDAGVHVVRSHQCIMLPGAELSTPESRQRFGLQTRFRVMHNTAEQYQLCGETFRSPEIDEICVASNSMTFQEYLDSRCFDLTVEIFYNNGIFAELFNFLKITGIVVSVVIHRIYERIAEIPTLATLYQGFLKDTGELWETRAELERFLQEPGVLERYAAGELGRNEQLAYKSLAFLEHLDALTELCYQVVSELLRQQGLLNQQTEDYLEELRRFDLLRKQRPLDTDHPQCGSFHYDFIAMREHGFKVDPQGYRLNQPQRLLFQHTPQHKVFVSGVKGLVASGLHGYAAIIGANPKIREYFREYCRDEGVAGS
ncbi:B12-binding domain-containing radical SAM protein [Trichlorobacter lovleyi]|uniref:B12-binding domain-containing radical SAM protein n=1 Tax=Trichlorobacter lovleyi TaxID=313985 RepID=UPI0023F4E4E2|nr:radical SAM protein [Trichlorobacter lovleyi]